MKSGQSPPGLPCPPILQDLALISTLPSRPGHGSLSASASAVFLMSIARKHNYFSFRAQPHHPSSRGGAAVPEPPEVPALSVLGSSAGSGAWGSRQGLGRDLPHLGFGFGGSRIATCLFLLTLM